MDFTAHINSLAETHGVAIEISSSGRGRAWRKIKKIRIREIKTAITYAVALHELGHIVGPQTGNRLNREWQSWEWAMANALTWNDTMTSKMQRCLASYLRWCNRRRGAWVPPSDHPVWTMAGQASTPIQISSS